MFVYTYFVMFIPYSVMFILFMSEGYNNNVLGFPGFRRCC
jgi:hypothetical protein